MKYEISAKPFPVLEMNLQRGESIFCEAGAMSWMSGGLEMETIGGGFGKALSRAFSGEKMFVNKYTSTRDDGMIAFSSKFLGTILAVDITPSTPIIVQKHAILAFTEGIDRRIQFQKVMKGLFGGEGFIMQEIFGNGTAFLEVDGEIREFDLAQGEHLILSSGFLLMMEKTCTMDLKTTGNLKNNLFGGEGFFNTVITGPGKVTVQTMPIAQLAKGIQPYIVTGK